MNTKLCRRCELTKNIDQFYKQKTSKDGMGLYCKKCANNIERKCLQNNRVKNIKIGFIEKPLVCYVCKQSKSSSLFHRDIRTKSGFSRKCKSCHSAARRFHSYGVKSDVVNDLIKNQNGKCSICENLLSKIFHVDHCHKTNSVRGILCNKCNVGLGMFGDDPAILRSATSYLERFSKEKTHVA